MRLYLILYCLLQYVFSYQVEWCLYFRLREIERPECKYYSILKPKPQTKRLLIKISNPIRPKPVATINANLVIPNKFIYTISRQGLPTCSVSHKYCVQSSRCNIGMQKCFDTVNFRECCARPNNNCPDPAHLGFRCIVRNPVSWCNEDRDCSNNTAKRCCPTGCNYNVCL